MTHEREYVLGTDDAELMRLGLQHRLWSAQAFACWERAGVKPGATVLDVGAGPGFAALDIAQLVAPTGRVVAVDESEKFLDYLNTRARALGVQSIETLTRDAQSLDLPPGTIDIAYARWVLCFTPRPRDVVAGVASALKPGGVFAVQDYVNWAALTLSPASDAFLRVMPAVGASWRSHGGDPQIGQKLPAMMKACGRGSNPSRLSSASPVRPTHSGSGPRRSSRVSSRGLSNRGS